MPKCIDGVRRSRFAVIRQTYPELRTTTIKTWESWLPPQHFGRISQVSPMRQLIKLKDLECEIYFLALESADDAKKLLSIEFTGFYFNELREIDLHILETAIGRLNRYPSAAMLPKGTTYFSFIIADTNAPDEEHWIADRFIKNNQKWPDFKIFIQPTPLIEHKDGTYSENPDAENIENLQGGYSYYWTMQRTTRKELFDVNVMCKFKSLFDGEPIFSEYNPNLHRANYIIKGNKDFPLLLGWDFGRTPCTVLAQYINGQLLILEEISCKDNIGLEEFVNVFVKPRLASEYAGYRIQSICDPAGVRKNDTDDNYCLMQLNKFGLNAIKAKTNALTPRIETLKSLLTTLVVGQPAFLLSANIKILHDAMAGGYKYKMIRDAAGRKVSSYEPDKSDRNPYTHLVDAVQYIALHCCYLVNNKVQQERAKIFVNGRYIDA